MSAPQMSLTDMRVIVSDALPTYPSHREDARRIVRHGYADVLAWLGEEVGPKPGAPTHVYRTARSLIVSPEAYERIKTLA
jgi:hypothetical protein